MAYADPDGAANCVCSTRVGRVSIFDLTNVLLSEWPVKVRDACRLKHDFVGHYRQGQIPLAQLIVSA